jgi:hypothetical protein
MTKCRAAVGGSRPIFGFQILFVYIHSLWQYSRSLVGYGIAWASRSTAGFGRRPRPPETTVVKESEWFCGFSFYPIPAIDGVFACCIEWTVLLFVFIRLPIHVDWNSSSWLVFQPVTTKDLPDKKRVLKSFFFSFINCIICISALEGKRMCLFSLILLQTSRFTRDYNKHTMGTTDRINNTSDYI